MNEIIEGEYEEVEDQHQQVEFRPWSPRRIPRSGGGEGRRAESPRSGGGGHRAESPRKVRLTGWTFQESKNEIGSQNSGKQGKLPQE